MPKVMGSAWMPCVRPTCTASWNSKARRLSTSPSADQVALQQLAAGLELQRQAGVEHVRAGHAVVDVLARLADVLGHVGEEGDHVVVGRLLDLGHPRRLEGRLGLDLGDRLGRHLAELRPGAHGGHLDLQPAAHLGLFGPQAGHLGQRVAFDHGGASVRGSRIACDSLTMRRAGEHAGALAGVESRHKHRSTQEG